MGYDSRFYAVRDYKFSNTFVDGYSTSEMIASLEMWKMGYSDKVKELLNLFDTKIPFTLYIGSCDDEGNEVMKDVIEDLYGDHICYLSDKEKAIKILKEIIKEDDYERFKWLLKFIKMFRHKDDVYICHYGH